MQTETTELLAERKREREIEREYLLAKARRILEGIEQRPLGSIFKLGTETMTGPDYRYRVSMIVTGQSETALAHNRYCARTFGPVREKRFALKGNAALLMNTKFPEKATRLLHDILRGAVDLNNVER